MVTPWQGFSAIAVPLSLKSQSAVIPAMLLSGKPGFLLDAR